MSQFEKEKIEHSKKTAADQGKTQKVTSQKKKNDPSVDI